MSSDVARAKDISGILAPNRRKNPIAHSGGEKKYWTGCFSVQLIVRDGHFVCVLPCFFIPYVTLFRSLMLTPREETCRIWTQAIIKVFVIALIYRCVIRNCLRSRATYR